MLPPTTRVVVVPLLALPPQAGLVVMLLAHRVQAFLPVVVVRPYRRSLRYLQLILAEVYATVRSAPIGYVSEPTMRELISSVNTTEFIIINRD